METNYVPFPLTLCIRFVTVCSQIEKYLNGTDALLIVYNPETETRSNFQNLASLLSDEFKYNPIDVATIASKSASSEVDPLTQVLPSCPHFLIDFKQPHFDGHLKVSQSIFFTF